MQSVDDSTKTKRYSPSIICAKLNVFCWHDLILLVPSEDYITTFFGGGLGPCVLSSSFNTSSVCNVFMKSEGAARTLNTEHRTTANKSNK